MRFDVKGIMQAVAYFIGSLLLSFIAWESSRWSTSIDELTKSVVGLNTRMEVMVSQVSNSTNEFTSKLADHELRIRENEKGILQLKGYRK